MSLNTFYQGATTPFATSMEFGATGDQRPASGTPGANPSGTGPGPEAHGPWIACDEAAGVVEIHDPRLLRRGREAFCRALVEAAVARFEAHWAAVSFETAICRMEFGAGRLGRTEMADRVASAVHAAIPAVREGAASAGTGRSSTAPDPAAPVPAAPTAVPEAADPDRESPPRGRRVVHAAMAGGSCALAAAAIILPGLPTLPFLIMTGRHAALASPRVERWLKRHPWLAAMLAEGEESPGPTIDWAALSRMIGLAVLFIAGIWILHPPLPVVLLLEIGLMAFLALSEWLGSRRADAGRLAAA
jgi:uncharacterized membrane protein YbaN (DUF454 family)